MEKAKLDETIQRLALETLRLSHPGQDATLALLCTAAMQGLVVLRDLAVKQGTLTG